MLAFEDFFEPRRGSFERNVLAWVAGELFGNEEALAEETLDLTGAGNDEFFFIGQFVHTENGDDVLQVFVALQHFLHAAGDVVVFFADDRVGQGCGRWNRVGLRLGRYLFGDTTVQNGGCIQVCEGGCWRWVGQVIGRDVDSLNGGDGTFVGGGDTFLHLAHFGGEVGW